MRHQIANGNNNNEIRGNEKEATTHGGTRHINAGALIFSMGIFLVALIIVATAIGVVSIPFTQTIKIILSNWGIRFNESIPAGMNSIVYFIRLPRVLTAVLVGAALGTCGAVMQGMFR
ncbi:MAG: iron chelate uptake ABC transporter family permease subunit, partial [Clostridiales bacterium]|nr:iron chelate uptake ABC transporter family permease subunit [Clostridiales bacterium]